MKKVISLIIILVMFTAVISVKAEQSEVTEVIAEHFGIEYTYDCGKLDTTSSNAIILISAADKAVVCVDAGSRIMEMYLFNDLIDWSSVSNALLTLYINNNVTIMYRATSGDYNGEATDLQFVLDVQRNINFTAMASLINAGGNV